MEKCPNCGSKAPVKEGESIMEEGLISYTVDCLDCGYISTSQDKIHWRPLGIRNYFGETLVLNIGRSKVVNE